MRLSPLSALESSRLMGPVPVVAYNRVMRALPRTALLLPLLAWLITAGTAAAQDEAPPGEQADRTAAPALDLNRLLQPRQAPDTRVRYGGKDLETWSGEFEQARSEVAALEQKIAEAQEKYRDASDAEWGYAPGGGGAPTDPEVLRIRAEIKRDRQSLEAARKRLRELGVAASLAGVPNEWIEAQGP